MSIYITKDGQKKKINVSATDVQLLDIDGRFKSKNLEDALKEVGSGTEENMTRIEERVEEKLHYPLKEVEDLNNEITASSFSFNNVPLNSPDNSAYYCDVVTWGDNEAFIEQTLRSIAYDTIYKRVKNARGWQPWRKYLFSDEIANPNLLINGDFQVWQRGTSFNGNTSRPVYTADRWIIAGDTAPKVEKVENGVKITSTQNGTWTNFYTKLENVTLRKLIGKTLTYTIKLKVPTRISQVWSVTVGTGGGEYHHSKVFNDKNYEYLTGSFVVKSTQFDDNGFFELGIQGIPEANNSFEIEYAKLELGSVSTPFVPRPYGEELALCQRYYFRNRWLSLRTAVCTENELRTSSYYFPVPMRVSPTINTVIGQPIHEFYTPNLTYHVGQPSLGTIAPKPMVIYNNVMCDFQFATNNVPKNDYTIEIKDNVYEFDAEIY